MSDAGYRATIELDDLATQEIDELVASGAARDREELIDVALRSGLERLRAAEMDRRYYELANDPELAADEEELARLWDPLSDEALGEDGN